MQNQWQSSNKPNRIINKDWIKLHRTFIKDLTRLKSKQAFPTLWV
jgi:hypothetical protein